MVNLSERVVRVRAPNPSPMTLTGTNSYLIRVAPQQAVVVDPGPAIEAHVDALAETAVELNLRVVAILVTHGHPDHFPAAKPLADRTGAPVWAHPNSHFAHDYKLDDGAALPFADATIEAIEAPGHTFDHLVFHLREERALFTGDVILGHGTVVIFRRAARCVPTSGRWTACCASKATRARSTAGTAKRSRSAGKTRRVHRTP